LYYVELSWKKQIPALLNNETDAYLQTIHQDGRLKQMIKRWIPLAQQ
jgi:hypothetical protein